MSGTSEEMLAFVNRDFTGYLVPVHADIPEVDAVILDGADHKANPFKTYDAVYRPPIGRALL